MKRSEIFFGLVRIPMDFLMVVSAFLLAYRLRLYSDFIPGYQFPINLGVYQTVDKYMQFTLSFAGIFIVFNAIRARYQLKTTQRFSKEIIDTFYGTILLVMAIITYFFAIHELFFSRLVLGFSGVFTLIFVVAGRTVIHLLQYAALHYGIGKRRVLILGDGEVTKKIAKQLKKDVRYEVLAPLSMCTTEALEQKVREEHVEEIIQTKSKTSSVQAAQILDFCREYHIDYHFVPDLIEVQRTNIAVQLLGGIPVLSLKPTPLDGWGNVLKRTMDLTFSVIGVAMLSPVLIAIAIGIKCDSPGPILYNQLDDGKPAMRVGRHGKPFRFLKFRTMHPNCHALRYTALKDHNARQNTPLVKIKNDPRITRLGRFLRRWSFDELPQLWNVISGDMSLVGPRPHLPEEVALYQRKHKFVHTIKPGITGLAQVSGRSDLPFEEEVRLDTYYIEHWSVWLDLKILLKTIGVVWSGKGAD